MSAHSNAESGLFAFAASIVSFVAYLIFSEGLHNYLDYLLTSVSKVVGAL